MAHKRRLEVGSAMALLLVVAGLATLWLRQKGLDDALVRELNKAPFDRQDRSRRTLIWRLSSRPRL